MAELDPSIVSAIANSNFKATAELPGLGSNILGQDAVIHARNANAAMIQTAASARDIAVSARGVLMKRISELDVVESSAAAPIAGHTQQYASASGAGMQSAQLGQSILQLGNSQQAIQVQLAQLIAILSSQNGAAA